MTHVSRKQKDKTYDILQQEMWQEYYRPFTISSIQKIFSYNMNSTLRNFHPKSPPPPPPPVPFPLRKYSDGVYRHDKTTVLSPFRPQHVPVDPAKHLPALQETKKDETRHRPRISLYRWLGSHVGDTEDQQRHITIKSDAPGGAGDNEKEPPSNKENKDALENVIQSLLDPKISSDETKEYERYSHHLVV